ncbi:hypothetical protein [Arthrobacter koreensis]|uniref:hypothetical protein n=1 Tax=Arthrobacter koreensis TaxID=199136 RepID=UPI00380F265F
MVSNQPDFDERDRQLHENSELLIGQMIANRDQLEAFHRDARRGRRKTEIAKHLEAADKNLFEYRSSFEVFTEHLINRGVLPESKRGRPVLENDPRTNAEKMGLSPDSPVFDGRREFANETAAGNPRKAASADPKGSGPGGTATPEKQAKPKSLPIGAPEVIQAAATGTNGNPEEGVAGAAARGFIGGASAGIRANLRADSGPATNKDARTAPVRNAEGQSLQDLAAQTPGEDALPGTTQPLALDVIDALQGKPAPRIVQNPEHIESLKAMEANRDDGPGRGADPYGR